MTTTTTNTTNNATSKGGAKMSNFMETMLKAREQVEKSNMSAEEKQKALAVIDKNISIGLQKRLVNSAYEFDAFKKDLTAMDYISVLSVLIDEDGEIIVTTKPIGVSRYTRKAITQKCAVVPTANGPMMYKEDYFADFTSNFAQVTFKDKDKLDYAEEGFYILLDNGRASVFIPVPDVKALDEQKLEFKFKDEDGNLHTKEELLERGAKHYAMLSYSASGTRNATALFVDITNKDIREKLLNDVSLGAYKKYTKWFDKQSAEGLDAAGLDKLFADAVIKKIQRFGQAATASNNMGVIDTWTHFKGNFGLDSSVHDGMCFLLDEYVAEKFSEYLSKKLGQEIVIAPSAVTGLILQIRPGMIKAAATVVTKEFMTLLVKNLENTGKSLKKHGKGEVPQMLVDDNSIKLDWDYKRVLHLELLAIGKKTPASTSIQALTKALFGAFYTGAKKELGTALTDLLVKQIKKDRDNLQTGKILNPQEWANGMIYDKIMFLDENEIHRNQALKQFKLDQFNKTEINKIEKIKIDVEGINGYLSDDITGMFKDGARVLSYGEIFVPYYADMVDRAYRELEAYMKANNNQYAGFAPSNSLVKYNPIQRANGVEHSLYVEVSMIKYPSVGLTELYNAKAIGRREIALRCFRLFGKDRTVERYFANLDKGQIVLPALEMVMDKMAGLDYDFDGCTLIAEPALVEFFKKVPEKATKIVKK